MTAQAITFESTVPGDAPQQSVGQYMSIRFSYKKRAQWEAEIQAGRIKINGHCALQHPQVGAGDQVAWTTLIKEPPVNDDIKTLYEDEHLLVVNKPTPLPCHAKAPYFRNTLIAILRQRHQQADLRLGHRLDSGTSGVLVLAKSSNALRGIMPQFEKRQVAKTYLAVCQGNPNWDQTQVDEPMLLLDHQGLKRWEVVPGSEGKPSQTNFKVLRRDTNTCLVQAEPRTGRTHQIRAHLFYLGHCILGDPLFNLNQEAVHLHRLWLKSDGAQGQCGRFGSSRLLLHASSLILQHPITKKTMIFKAPLPTAFSSPQGHD